MNDIDKLVQAIVEQDTLAGQNPLLTEDDIQQMKLMSTVDDVQAFAITKGIPAAKVNNALISAGLDAGADPLDDISGLFGFGAEALPGIIGGLPSSYTPRNPADTDFYREGDEYNSAMRLVLGRQNRIGVKSGEKDIAWNEALLLYQNEPLPSGEEVSVYLPPDYSEVSTRIRNLFTENLGRQPKGYELKLLAEQFYADATLQSQQQSELQELALGPTVEELETGNIGTKDIQGVVAETGLQEVSPTGRLYENFNNLIQKEKDRLQANADIQTTGRNMLGTILGTRR